MKSIFKIFPVIAISVFTLLAFSNPQKTTIATEVANTTTAIKCMIQMKNYTGEGAYVVISLINNKNEYEDTLFVHGKDTEWYNDITNWWAYFGKHRVNIDAISGATISGGERTITLLKIPNNKIDAGYSIRFETAAEDLDYNTKDVQFALTTKSLESKVNGTGFIRYIRLLPQ